MTNDKSQHFVVIIGGAVAGSEAAFQLTQRGVLCVVVEQNERPYGKVEDGLPRWHEKLRLQEEKKIDDKLSHPAVHFVPRTKVGVDLTLDEILSWGVSAVVFANGAWRDRPLPLPGIDQFVGKGFCYQNALVYMFNHYLEPGYKGPLYELADGALVVGGGLGSLDVVKILMLETVVRALEARGRRVELYELEHAGIKKGLGELGLTLSDLNLKGCTLIYRRRTEDMPVAQPDENATPEQMETTRATRRKLLNNFSQKYLFTFQNQRTPAAYLAEDGHLTGLRLAATEANNGRLIMVPGSEYEFRSSLVVSSIGSIPEPIPGIQMNGEVYRIKDESTGEVEGHERVFAVGNAVTGRGNILASRRHGRVVSQHMLEHYLQGTASGYEEVLQDAASEMAAKMSAMVERLARQAPPSPATVAAALARVKSLQKRVGYSDGYAQWIERVRPKLA
jgi:NADPH-dependent glutamate synthase beta subunit-like oxidoreductase